MKSSTACPAPSSTTPAAIVNAPVRNNARSPNLANIEGRVFTVADERTQNNQGLCPHLLRDDGKPPGKLQNPPFSQLSHCTKKESNKQGFWPGNDGRRLARIVCRAKKIPCNSRTRRGVSPYCSSLRWGPQFASTKGFCAEDIGRGIDLQPADLRELKTIVVSRPPTTFGSRSSNGLDSSPNKCLR